MKKISSWLFVAAFLLTSLACMPPVAFRVVDNQVVTDCYGDILPCTDATYDLGSQTQRWHSLYVENLITPAVGVNGVYDFYTGGVSGMVKQIIVADGKIIFVEVEP